MTCTNTIYTRHYFLSLRVNNVASTFRRVICLHPKNQLEKSIYISTMVFTNKLLHIFRLENELLGIDYIVKEDVLYISFSPKLHITNKPFVIVNNILIFFSKNATRKYLLHSEERGFDCVIEYCWSSDYHHV